MWTILQLKKRRLLHTWNHVFSFSLHSCVLDIAAKAHFEHRVSGYKSAVQCTRISPPAALRKHFYKVRKYLGCFLNYANQVASSTSPFIWEDIFRAFPMFLLETMLECIAFYHIFEYLSNYVLEPPLQKQKLNIFKDFGT